jgi:hypothetical protein
MVIRWRVTLLLMILAACSRAAARPSAADESGRIGASAAGYGLALGDDTLRARPVANAAQPRRATSLLGATVRGYLSARGLPPLQGIVTVTDTGLVFRSFDGHYAAILPVVGPVRESTQGRWRASAISLAYVDTTLGPASFLFRVDGGVFETDAPGALLELAGHPSWLDTLHSREWSLDRPLVANGNSAATGTLIQSLVNGGYADTLYGLFGRPLRPVGLVGERGRAAGRLGEYVAARDSLALDPARITSVAQLRHTLAHELAHRWQARTRGTLATLWVGVPPIRDPNRYGYGNVGEQQAEAAAFAVHFLIATARDPVPEHGLQTLNHYELLVPGTRALARYFALQPTFHAHPLRRLLTLGTSRPTS